MRVMLIEDDALVRRMISEALDEEGMEVDGLASAEDALVLLGAGQVPDVLVADVNLGAGLSGSTPASIATPKTRSFRFIRRPPWNLPRRDRGSASSWGNIRRRRPAPI